MFGISDNSGGTQNPAQDNNSSAPDGQQTPVHGPLSNISPGTSSPDPQPAAPAPAPPSSDISHFSEPASSFSPPDSVDSGSQDASEDTTATGPDSELLGIKQEALAKLAPLMDHLEQTPEEKFRTTMMLIQASDNSQLLREAYETANQIEDEKVRANALLDVINEINYFSHHGNSNTAGGDTVN